MEVICKIGHVEHLTSEKLEMYNAGKPYLYIISIFFSNVTVTFSEYILSMTQITCISF